jgi:SET domain-containing protein
MPKHDRKLAVKRSVTGLGLFTLQPIPAGERIIEFVGNVITGEEAEVKGGKYLFEINENC